MTLPNGEYFRVAHKLLIVGGQRLAYCTYCVRSLVGDNVDDVAVATRSYFAAGPVTNMTTEWSLVETLVKQGPDETGPQAVLVGTAVAGTEAAPTATPQCAYLIHKNTGTGGRRGRGRMYLPGVKESYVGAAGALDSTITAALTTQFNEWFNGLSSISMPVHLEHEPATVWELVGGQPRRVPVAGAVPAPTPVTSVSPDARVATQRRRMR